MATPSGLLSKPKLTNIERLRERLKTTEIINIHYRSSLKTYHFDELTRPTIRNHNAIKKLYHEFGLNNQEEFDAGDSELQPQALEIVMDTPLPPLGKRLEALSILDCSFCLQNTSRLLRASWHRLCKVEPSPLSSVSLRSSLTCLRS